VQRPAYKDTPGKSVAWQRAFTDKLMPALISELSEQKLETKISTDALKYHWAVIGQTMFRG